MTTLPSVARRAHGDERRAERAARRRRPCAGAAGVEELERARHLQLGVRRHGVDGALVARRDGSGSRAPTGSRSRPARDGAGRGSTATRRARLGLGLARRRRPRRAPRRGRRPRSRESSPGSGAGRWSARRARSRAGTTRGPLAATADRRVVEPLADPALVRRARRCTARRPSRRDPRVQEDVGVLAPQQRAPADVAGHDGRVRAGSTCASRRVEANGGRPGTPVRGSGVGGLALPLRSATTFCARWAGTSS